MRNILIIEGGAVSESSLASTFELLNCTPTYVANIAQAKRLGFNGFQLLICDLVLDDGLGVELVSQQHSCPVIILSKTKDSASIIEAMRVGIADFIVSPFIETEFSIALERIFKKSAERKNLAASVTLNADENTPHDEPLFGMIGSSAAMQTVYSRVRKAAPTRSTILIRGETGTGKELIARAIHDASDRAENPFIAVNCAAIPETLIESELFGHEKGAFTGAASKRAGLIEAAEGGTLFLDEIGELPSEAQARLLRFIQESEIRRIGSNEAHRVNVRLVAATHRDLKKLTTTGGFRPDLYYRINVVRIDLPSLKQRGNDLLEIAEFLLDKAANRHEKAGLHLSPEAIQIINNYPWPGNVRELENVIERAAIMCEGLEINSETLEIDSDINENHRFNADILTPFTGNYLDLQQPTNSASHSSGNVITNLDSAPDTSEELSLEDYFQRFVLENQEHMNETELAKKLGISRKCLWERRQRLAIPRAKSGNKSSDSAL